MRKLNSRLVGCATCGALPVGTFHDGSPRYGCGPHPPIMGTSPTPTAKNMGRYLTFRRCIHCDAIAPAGTFEWVHGGSWGDLPVRTCPYCGVEGLTGYDFVKVG